MVITSVVPSKVPLPVPLLLTVADVVVQGPLTVLPLDVSVILRMFEPNAVSTIGPEYVPSIEGDGEVGDDDPLHADIVIDRQMQTARR
jgi:hypothetical protein